MLAVHIWWRNSTVLFLSSPTNCRVSQSTESLPWELLVWLTHWASRCQARLPSLCTTIFVALPEEIKGWLRMPQALPLTAVVILILLWRERNMNFRTLSLSSDCVGGDKGTKWGLVVLPILKPCTVIFIIFMSLFDVNTAWVVVVSYCNAVEGLIAACRRILKLRKHVAYLPEGK